MTTDVNELIREMINLDKSSLPPDGGSRFNRLIFASSPYLLQHAENPVEWYQWGEEAFRKAREENKPVFLSIGYATCHWCHVMAHESFEDQEVAAALNRDFVAIKVDREERPDIDDQYMTVAQLMTGSGGWPLNLFLSPDLKPFYAATYIPKRPRGGMLGFIELLERIAELWTEERARIEENCVAVLDGLARVAAPAGGKLPGKEIMQQARRQLEAGYDPEWGGFGSAPKFPMPHYLMFLLRSWHSSRDSDLLAMAEHSLRNIRQGGVYDQIGFGCHRYSVDQQWLVPHFEKMLYDQAMVSLAALETFQATGKSDYLEMAEEIFSFVLREMTSPEGGFYSAMDADSEGEEGTYYLWTPAQIKAILGDEAGNRCCRLFAVTDAGNFEGKNILHLPLPLEKFASREGIDLAQLCHDLEAWREKLLSERETRIRPFLDRKVLVAWNGLMIAALAKGYAFTGISRYREAAERALAFIAVRLHLPSGRLLRFHHLGGEQVPAFLEDYAFLVWGVLELHQATMDPPRLADARRLTAAMIELFSDPAGGFYDSGSDAEQLLIRSKTAHDGVIPSGNAVAAMNLLRLGRITGDDDLAERGKETLRAVADRLAQQPTAGLFHLMALGFDNSPTAEVTLVGRPGAAETESMLRAIGRHYLPNLVLRGGEEGGLAGMPGAPGRCVAYVCAAGACRPPVTEPAELERLLEEIQKVGFK